MGDMTPFQRERARLEKLRPLSSATDLTDFTEPDVRCRRRPRQAT